MHVVVVILLYCFGDSSKHQIPSTNESCFLEKSIFSGKIIT